MAREINLVPDIKNDMIKALKLRNLIFFLSFVVAAISIGVTVVAGITAGGQQIAIDNRKSTIEALSNKISSYEDLKDFLTIKDQLSDIAGLTDNKTVFSRTFNILSAFKPSGADTIQISELNIDLTGEAPVFSLEAQANAGQAPFIDYNVLDAFKKSTQYVRYDYGRYVDKNGDDIPAYCIIESNDDGSFFNDPSKGLYAFWTINAEGCNPADKVTAESETDSDQDTESSTPSREDAAKAYELEDYNGQQVVRIWRTPQFADWYKETEVDGQPYMSLDGQISNVQHFESSCITYTGDTTNDSASPKWTEANDTCLLVPEGEDGITIYESSNGRDESGELVLRFSANIVFDPAVFSFKNTHMIALAPAGRRNVTDSYIQVQSMFGERAADCAANDTACADAKTDTKTDTKTNTEEDK